MTHGGRASSTQEAESAGRDLLPPLAPPAAAHEDAQVRVPAVRQVGVGIEVEEAVVAPVLATELLERVRTQDRSIHDVLPLEPLLTVDLLRFRRRDVIVGHRRNVPGPRDTTRRTV